VLLSLLLFILLPAMLLSVGLALIPWKPLPFRTCLLGAHVLASGFLVVLLPLRWEVLLFFLGPGAALALLRLLEAALELRDLKLSRQGRPKPD
jgi:hypothetical protein